MRTGRRPGAAGGEVNSREAVEDRICRIDALRSVVNARQDTAVMGLTTYRIGGYISRMKFESFETQMAPERQLDALVAKLEHGG